MADIIHLQSRRKHPGAELLPFDVHTPEDLAALARLGHLRGLTLILSLAGGQQVVRVWGEHLTNPDRAVEAVNRAAADMQRP